MSGQLTPDSELGRQYNAELVARLAAEAEVDRLSRDLAEAQREIADALAVLEVGEFGAASLVEAVKVRAAEDRGLARDLAEAQAAVARVEAARQQIVDPAQFAIEGPLIGRLKVDHMLRAALRPIPQEQPVVHHIAHVQPNGPIACGVDSPPRAATIWSYVTCSDCLTYSPEDVQP